MSKLHSRPSRPGLLSQTWLIATQEFTKGFFNIRGIIALAVYCLVWGLLLYYPIRGAASFIADPHSRALLSDILGMASPKELLSWQVPELALFWVISLYWFPLFAMAGSADQFASDLRRKTLRYLTQRCGRNALLFGRVLGHLLIQGCYIVTAGIASLTLAFTREPTLLTMAIYDLMFVLINLFIIIVPYVALMAILSLLASSSRQAILLAVLIWCLLKIIIAVTTHYLPTLPSLDWLLPGSQIDFLLDITPSGALQFATMPLLQGLFLLILGTFVMRRKDL